MTTRASACNPIDFVSAAGLVKVPQDLISGMKFTRIDFGGWNKIVRVAKGN
jgi:hypothetical protein